MNRRMDQSRSGDRGAALEQRFPLGARVSLEALADDPYPIFHELREKEPVSWVPDLGMWLLTRRDDILAVLADPDTFTTDSASSTIRDVFGRQMLSTDGPDWIRFKRACMPPFRKEALVGDLRYLIGEAVDDLIARFDGLHTVDLRAELAVPLSLGAVLRVMGLPAQDGRRIHDWYGDFAEALANFKADARVRDRGHASARDFRDYMEPIIRGDVPVPSRSLLGHLLAGPGNEDSAASDRPARALTDPEIVSNLLIVLFGGVETADSMISTCLYAVLSNPELRDEARRSPDRLPVLVDEILRWGAPVQSCTRFATGPTVIRGVEIHEGETVQCMLGAANRDPRCFPDPDRLDPGRENAHEHLSFGAGRHFCLGAVMARMETEVALGAVLEAFPRATLVDPDEARPRGHEFRRPPTLRVRLRG